MSLVRSGTREQLGLLENQLDCLLLKVGWVAVDDQEAADLGS